MLLPSLVKEKKAGHPVQKFIYLISKKATWYILIQGSSICGGDMDSSERWPPFTVSQLQLVIPIYFSLLCFCIILF